MASLLLSAKASQVGLEKGLLSDPSGNCAPPENRRPVWHGCEAHAMWTGVLSACLLLWLGQERAVCYFHRVSVI